MLRRGRELEASELATGRRFGASRGRQGVGSCQMAVATNRDLDRCQEKRCASSSVTS